MFSSPPAQGMLHRVIILPEGCGTRIIFHLRMSDINEPRAGPTESESGGVVDSEPNVSLTVVKIQ